MTEKNTTVRESLLTNRAFKIVGYLSLISLIIVLIAPILPSFPYKGKVINFIAGIFFFAFGDWLVTFLQHHSVNAIISIIVGYTLALIIGVLLMFYSVAI